MLNTETPGDIRRKFVAENGEHILDSTQCWHIFQNGAMMEREIMGALIPAFKMGDRNVTPMMVKQTLHRRLYYAQAKLGAAIRAFETLKKDLESRANESFANAAMPPDAEEVAELHKLKAEVEKFQALAETADAESNPPKPAPSTEQIQRETIARQAASAALAEIRSIEV